MKIDAYDIRDKKIKLEVYKVQITLFGGPGCLIYNEDRTEIWETHNENEVNQIKNFIKSEKAFVAGQYNKKTGKIIIMHLLPDKDLF